MTLQFFTMPSSPNQDDLLLEHGMVLVTLNRPVKGACHYCGKKATTRDHIVPKSGEGRNAWWNLVPACRKCNEQKSSTQSTCTCIWCQRARFFMRQYLDWGEVVLDVRETVE